MYNLTDLQSSDTILKLVDYANTTTEGLLFGLFLWAVFFISIFVMKEKEFIVAVTTASYICFVLSALLSFADLISFFTVLIFLLMVAFSTFYLYLTKK